jgi:hypothetical protein
VNCRQGGGGGSDNEDVPGVNEDLPHARDEGVVEFRQRSHLRPDALLRTITQNYIFVNMMG